MNEKDFLETMLEKVRRCDAIDAAIAADPTDFTRISEPEAWHAMLLDIKNLRQRCEAAEKEAANWKAEEARSRLYFEKIEHKLSSRVNELEGVRPEVATMMRQRADELAGDALEREDRKRNMPAALELLAMANKVEREDNAEKIYEQLLVEDHAKLTVYLRMEQARADRAEGLVRDLEDRLSSLCERCQENCDCDNEG